MLTNVGIPQLAQLEYKKKWQIWLYATRPKTLAASVAPVFIGSAMAYSADEEFRGWVAALCLFSTMALQVGTNLANDYFDFLKGTDRADRQGPPRVLTLGWLQRRELYRGMLLSFAVAAILGLILSFVRGGWPVVLILLLGILAGIGYTGGPFPLAYHGLGDFFAFIFFGPVAVAATYYVHALNLSPAAIMMGSSPGAFAVAMIAINNYRDRETDGRSGKHTLALRFGKTFARGEISLALILGIVTPFFLEWHLGNVMLLFLLFPGGIILRDLWMHENGKVLNSCLARTGQLMLLHSLLLSMAWIFS